MSKQITELMEHLEDELLENITEIELDEGSVKRIKERTKCKIEEREGSEESKKKQEEYFVGDKTQHSSSQPIDLQEAKKGRVKLGKLKKALLIAAVLCGLMGVAVGAISISPTLQEFFSERLDLVTPHAQDIQKSVSHNGVTMTVDTAVAGNSGSILILRVTKDDGSTFEEESEFRDFKVYLLEGGSNGYAHGWELSEDKKVLTYIIHFKTMASIVDSTIEIIGKDVVRVTQQEEVLPIDLSQVTPARERELFSEEIIVHETGDVKLEMPENGELKGIDLEHPYSDVVLGSVGFKNGTFFTYMEYKEKEDALWQMYRLIDTRTGETLFSTGSEGKSSSRGAIHIEKTYYEGITPEELPYLKLVKMYNTYETFVEGEWKLSFTLEPNQHVKTFKGKKSVPFEGGSYEVKDIEVCALGATINGIQNFDTGQDVEQGRPELSFKLKFQDGSEMMMNTVMQSGYGSGETLDLYIEAGEPWSSFTEEEKEEKRREAEESMYERAQGYDYFLEIPIIDIEKVESIQIEDVIFKLK